MEFGHTGEAGCVTAGFRPDETVELKLLGSEARLSGRIRSVAGGSLGVEAGEPIAAGELVEISAGETVSIGEINYSNESAEAFTIGIELSGQFSKAELRSLAAEYGGEAV